MFNVGRFVMASLIRIPSKWGLSIDNGSCSSDFVLVTLKVLMDPIHMIFI